ncbi:hypothetical protein [Candidatus Bealeia paramacronuclearis]|uniref:hypothetical protein n=1 Tax=Candidatus Bealeia paramacronuclearis TaxID=1921001 RepID=UPI002F25F2AD
MVIFRVNPDRAKGIAAGLYAGNYLLPMLLGTIESWINPEGQAPLTVGLLSAFHKEMQTVGHGLTAAINALDLDAEEKAAWRRDREYCYGRCDEMGQITARSTGTGC